MLKTLTLKNYRGFANHEIVWEEDCIVIGRNNAGKSTIVEALRLVAVATQRYQSISYRDTPGWITVPTGPRGFKPSLDGLDINLKSVVNFYDDPPAEIVAVFANGEKVEICLHPEQGIFCFLWDSKGRPVRGKGEARRLGLPAVKVLPQVAPLLAKEVVISRDRVREHQFTTLSSLHFRNQLHHFAEDWVAFKDMAENSWPGLRLSRLEAISIGPAEKELSLLVEEDHFTAEVAWMGHGLQMWLQTIWFLSRCQEDDVLVLDEPDVYMHADLQRRLVRSLQRNFRQTIVATHSVEIMSEVSPNAILIVDKRRERSDFAASLPAVQAAIESFGSNQNIQLARLWSSPRCSLVEGDDLGILKSFQDRLIPHGGVSLDVVPHWDMGGWGGWKAVLASKLPRENADGRLIRNYCIFDSDHHPPALVDRRYEEAKHAKIQLHIWTRKEIENYLLSPEVIARLIAKTAKIRKRLPTSKVVEQEIRAFFGSNERSVFDDIATQYSLFHPKHTVKNANAHARAVIDKATGTLDGILRLVPGKELVKHLAHWAQTNWQARVTTYAIVGEMEPDEVPREVCDLIEFIEQAAQIPAGFRTP